MNYHCRDSYGTSKPKNKFAEQYPRTPEGWIKFPEDGEVRRAIFPEEVMKHPAKANLFMMEEIINYVSSPSDILLDPMSGTGSLLIAVTMGRRVVLIDVEEGYYHLQQEALEKLELVEPSVCDQATLLLGDCLAFLPLPCNHIIFSPPYGTALKRKSKPITKKDKVLGGEYDIPEYCYNPKNLSNLSDFLYNQKMEQIYQKCFASLPPGGTMTIILKDHTKGGKRIKLSDWAMRVSIRAGFELQDWFKRYSRGTGYLQLHKSKGVDVVEDEDLIIMQRPAKPK